MRKTYLFSQLHFYLHRNMLSHTNMSQATAEMTLKEAGCKENSRLSCLRSGCSKLIQNKEPLGISKRCENWGKRRSNWAWHQRNDGYNAELEWHLFQLWATELGKMETQLQLVCQTASWNRGCILTKFEQHERAQLGCNVEMRKTADGWF